MVAENQRSIKETDLQQVSQEASEESRFPSLKVTQKEIIGAFVKVNDTFVSLLIDYEKLTILPCYLRCLISLSVNLNHFRRNSN